MSAATILTLANRRGIDLLNPTVEDYADFGWQAEHIAKEARYNGATPGTVYSVAEHAARAADAAWRATRDVLVAAAVLVHDDPEAVTRDQTTPLKNAYAEIIATTCGVLAPQIIDCFADLERRHARCVHLAAGLPWPLPYGLQEAVHHFDKVMFVTEWRDLMENQPHPDWSPYAAVAPLPGVIRPVSWKAARLMWLDRARRFLPVFEGRRNRPLHELFPALPAPTRRAAA